MIRIERDDCFQSWEVNSTTDQEDILVELKNEDRQTKCMRTTHFSRYFSGFPNRQYRVWLSPFPLLHQLMNSAAKTFGLVDGFTDILEVQDSIYVEVIHISRDSRQGIVHIL